MAEEDKGISGPALLVGGLGVGALGAALATLFISKPAEAAPPEEKLKYFTDLLEAVAEGQAQLIAVLEQWLAAQGVIPGVEVSVRTAWEAKDPEEIYEEAIRSIGTFQTEGMVDFRNAKRIIFKVESTLDQAVNIQPVGNIFDDFTRATNINGVFPCVANGNIHIGLAWDDWMPFVGLRITTAVAPVTGILKIWAVVQE